MIFLKPPSHEPHIHCTRHVCETNSWKSLVNLSLYSLYHAFVDSRVHTPPHSPLHTIKLHHMRLPRRMAHDVLRPRNSHMVTAWCKIFVVVVATAVFLQVFLRSPKFATSKSMLRARHVVTTWRNTANAIREKTRNTARLKCGTACHENQVFWKPWKSIAPVTENDLRHFKRTRSRLPHKTTLHASLHAFSTSDEQPQTVLYHVVLINDGCGQQTHLHSQNFPDNTLLNKNPSLRMGKNAHQLAKLLQVSLLVLHNLQPAHRPTLSFMSSILAVKKSMSRLTMRAQRLQHGNMLQPPTVVVVARNPGPGLSGQHILDAVHLASTQDDLTNWPKVYDGLWKWSWQRSQAPVSSWKYIGKYLWNIVIPALSLRTEAAIVLRAGFVLETNWDLADPWPSRQQGWQRGFPFGPLRFFLCLAGNLREWPIITSFIIIPATPSNPSIPYVKRTSKKRGDFRESSTVMTIQQLPQFCRGSTQHQTALEPQSRKTSMTCATKHHNLS